MFWSFDLLVCACILIFFFIGIYRGFIDEIFRFLGVVASFFISYFFFNRLIPLLNFLSLSWPVKAAISFVVLYIICLIGFFCIGKILKKLFHLTPLGIIDRVAGGALGAIKGAIICFTGLMLLTFLPKTLHNKLLADSYCYRWVNKYSHVYTFAASKKLFKDSFESAAKTTPLKTISNVKKKIEYIKEKVDSAKSAQGDSLKQ